MEDILIWSKESCDSRLGALLDLEPLQEKLLFLHNFIRFVKMQGKSAYKLIPYCEVGAENAAYICCSCWAFRDVDQVFDGINLQISRLIEKIKSVDPQVRADYIESISSSFTRSTKTGNDVFLVGNFVESLLSNLCGLINSRTGFMISVEHQMQILSEGLQFLRDILIKYPEKHNGLPERMKDIIGAVVNNAGVVIFSLYQNEIEEASAREIDVKLFRLLEEIGYIKVTVEDLMTCIDSVLDKLQLHKDDHDLYRLKVELRLVKTFSMCARRFNRSGLCMTVLFVQVHRSFTLFSLD
ncbi:hypothetical protein ACH5RR_021303 [Cinchona calisaya]|uniref:Late blight resistance protein R1A-like N-terminal domain-containing protein n=1 Tax=Cinchona calisaya TaxID=153742 RepID=A0ABD2ZGY5_9GENT